MVFGGESGRQRVAAPCMGIVERDVAEILLFLELAAIYVALRPHPCGAELRVLVGGVRVAAECRQIERRRQLVEQSHVCVEVHLLLVTTFGKYGRRRIDTICRTVLCPVAVGIATGRISRVLTSSGVEQHLRVEDVVVLVRRAEHTEVADETVVESMLRDINLCHKIVVVLGLYDGIMVDITERRTIVRLFGATAESQVMVLNKAGSSDYVVEVVFVSAVVGVYPEAFGSSKIFVSRQHVEFL